MTSVATREASPAVHAAHEVTARIIKNKREAQVIWLKIAEDLYKVRELSMWRDLGYSSFEAYLAQPDLDIKRRSAHYALEMWGELVVKRQVDPKRLERVSPAKVQEVLPSIRRGYAEPEEALSDCEVMPRDELRTSYAISKHGTTAGAPTRSDPLDGEAEQEWAVCATCGSRYPVRKP